MSVTGSGQTRNPFTLHLVFIITVSVATFFPLHNVHGMSLLHTHTKELQKFVMEITSASNMADCRHPSDPKCGINPYYRQTISTCTTKKGRKSFVTDRMGDGPPTVGVSYFHWGERKQVGHRYWAQSSWVGCCSVSSRFWFRTAEMLIHRDLFLSSISLTISPSFIWRHLCVCSKRHCLGTFHLLFLLIIRLICFSSTPRSTKEKKLFSWNSISEDLKKERNEIVFLPSAHCGKK